MNEAVRNRMCLSKARLLQRDAERKAFWRGMRAYHCPLCDWWHLTTRNAPLYKRKAPRKTGS